MYVGNKTISFSPPISVVKEMYQGNMLHLNVTLGSRIRNGSKFNAEWPIFSMFRVRQTNQSVASVERFHYFVILSVQLEIENVDIVGDAIFVHRLWYGHNAQFDLEFIPDIIAPATKSKCSILPNNGEQSALEFSYTSAQFPRFSENTEIPAFAKRHSADPADCTQ